MNNHLFLCHDCLQWSYSFLVNTTNNICNDLRKFYINLYINFIFTESSLYLSVRY